MHLTTTVGTAPLPRSAVAKQSDLLIAREAVARTSDRLPFFVHASPGTRPVRVPILYIGWPKMKARVNEIENLDPRTDLSFKTS